MDGLKPGRIVNFVFDEQSAQEVNRRRTTGASIAERMKYGDDPQLKAWPAGAQAHIGNDVSPRAVYPAMVVRVWSDDGLINCKVFLDGSDDYWATSVRHDQTQKTARSWHWMFEGQQTRYRPDRTEAASDGG